jgi:hypothetical protein
MINRLHRARVASVRALVYFSQQLGKHAAVYRAAGDVGGAYSTQ